MNHEWIVFVRDDKKAVLTTAEVCFAQQSVPLDEELPYPSVSVTHRHSGAGKYEMAEAVTPVDGDWILIVRLKGRSPVVQPLTMKGKKGEFTTTAKSRLAATVQLKSETVAVADSSVRRTTFTVTLHPASEVVFISGLEYFDAGTQFHMFAEKRREVLRREQKLDAGSLVTIFSCDHRRKETTVLSGEKAWLSVQKTQYGPAGEVKPGKNHEPVKGKDISATHLYEYLSQVGTASPGRVREVGWFCHSWHGGPVLFNTSDNRDDADDSRDPDDFDGREKDFNDTNRKSWPKLKEALAATCTWRVWGCSATTHIKDMMRYALKEKAKKTAEDKLFLVQTEVHYHGSPGVARNEDETITLQTLRAFVDEPFHYDSYCASAADFLDIPCYGSPPGVGSNFVTVNGLSLMMIEMSSYTQVYNYCKDEFGPEFKPTNSTYDKGYIDYNALRKRDRYQEPKFQPGLYKFTRNHADGYWGIDWYNGQGTFDYTVNVKLKVTQTKGFGASKIDGVLYVIKHHKDDARSKAFFATKLSSGDGMVYVVERGATSKEFDVLGAPLGS